MKKSTRNKRIQALRKQIGKDYLKTVPFEADVFLGLYLSLTHRQNFTCDHTLQESLMYLKNKCSHFDENKAMSFFEDEGAYCDCEVIHNLFDPLLEEDPMEDMSYYMKDNSYY